MAVARRLGLDAQTSLRAMPCGTWILDEQTPPEWLDEPEATEPTLEQLPVFVPAEVAHGA